MVTPLKKGVPGDRSAIPHKDSQNARRGCPPSGGWPGSFRIRCASDTGRPSDLLSGHQRRKNGRNSGSSNPQDTTVDVQLTLEVPSIAQKMTHPFPPGGGRYVSGASPKILGNLNDKD